LAAIDKAQAFNNPKEFAVWLGLTPKQHASGNISKMGDITKRGDRYYLRKQLIHGARALVSCASKSTDPLALLATKLRVTKPFNQVAVCRSASFSAFNLDITHTSGTLSRCACFFRGQC
jgi:transposase